MSLDKLYEIAKMADYPIRNRKELIAAVGDEIITFEGHYFDAEEIAVHIREYPIHTPSDLIKFFLVEESEAYGTDQAKYLAEFDMMMEG